MELNNPGARENDFQSMGAQNLWATKEETLFHRDRSSLCNYLWGQRSRCSHTQLKKHNYSSNGIDSLHMDNFWDMDLASKRRYLQTLLEISGNPRLNLEESTVLEKWWEVLQEQVKVKINVYLLVVIFHFDTTYCMADRIKKSLLHKLSKTQEDFLIHGLKSVTSTNLA